MSIISQLKKSLPKNIIISGDENTRPFECDGLSVYKQKPLAVVLPNEIKQVKKVLEICRKNKTPIVTRGAGTGLSGGAMPIKDSVVLGLSKLTEVTAWQIYSYLKAVLVKLASYKGLRVKRG